MNRLFYGFVNETTKLEKRPFVWHVKAEDSQLQTAVNLIRRLRTAGVSTISLYCHTMFAWNRNYYPKAFIPREVIPDSLLLRHSGSDELVLWPKTTDKPFIDIANPLARSIGINYFRGILDTLYFTSMSVDNLHYECTPYGNDDLAKFPYAPNAWMDWQRIYMRELKQSLGRKFLLVGNIACQSTLVADAIRYWMDTLDGMMFEANNIQNWDEVNKIIEIGLKLGESFYFYPEKANVEKYLEATKQFYNRRVYVCGR